MKRPGNGFFFVQRLPVGGAAYGHPVIDQLFAAGATFLIADMSLSADAIQQGQRAACHPVGVNIFGISPRSWPL